MELRQLGRVLRRFRHVVVLGTTAAILLAVVSYFSVSFDGWMPKLTPSKKEVWQASSTTFLTQPGFPVGQVERSGDALRFIGLAPLYAKLANSDAVKELMTREGGPLVDDATAIGSADTTYGTVSGLPMVTIIGTAPTAERAVRSATRLTNAFVDYVTEQQNRAGIAEKQRIEIQVLNAAGDPQLVVPRKKTLPIVVLLAVLFATLALTIVLENLRPRPLPVEAEQEQEPEPRNPALSDVFALHGERGSGTR